MEAITQKHEDAHVLMLSDMFTAIPATTIRRYLRENGGDMERTAAALIEVNDKYPSIAFLRTSSHNRPLSFRVSLPILCLLLSLLYIYKNYNIFCNLSNTDRFSVR